MAAIPTPSTNRTGNTGKAPAVAATIRAMVICVADELPRESLAARQLDQHFGVSGSLCPRFWAKPDVRFWERKHLFDLQKAKKNQPAYCAGGPAQLLDLTGMHVAASMGAGIRHRSWQAAVHGTKDATPWAVFEARNLEDPSKFPLEDLVAAFYSQPRVNAIRMHNATYTNAPLALEDLEIYQAGHAAYQNYSGCTAVVGDALLRLDGTQLAPASDRMADRVTYHEQATRYMATLGDDQRLLAVAL
jgi:hypothetical protein